MMLKMDTYLKRISPILVIYTILTTTTHSPISRWRLVVICIHPLSEQNFPIVLPLKVNSLPICEMKSSMWYTIATSHYTSNWVLTFKQSTWLNTYIDFNTRQRALPGSSVLKDFFKLMDNSVFGKKQENLRKRVHVELITDGGTLHKRVAKPSFYNPITDCLTVVQCKVATLTLNRPIYMGFSVLALSKLHM